MEFLVSSIDNIMLIANRDNSIFFHSNLDAFYFFPCLVALATICSNLLNKSGKSGHLVPLFFSKKKSFQLFTVSVILLIALGLSYMTFIVLRYIHSITNLFKVFIMKGC